MVIQQQKTREYYSTGKKDDIVISNSFLNALDPELGGSPQKAISIFDKPSEETKSMENGKIIHAYAEKPEAFGIADIPRPSDTLGDLCDAINDILHGKFAYDPANIEIVSVLKTDGGKSAEILETKKAFEDLSARMSIEVNKLIPIFRTARTITEAYKTYKEKTIIDTLISKGGIEYIKQLQKLENKVILSPTDKLKIESGVKALREHPATNKYLALADLFDTNIVLKEWDLYFMFRGFKCKARLDNIYIDIQNKKIIIGDLKSTFKPLSLFPSLIEERRYYRQLAFYGLAFTNSLEKLIRELDVDLINFQIVYLVYGLELTENSVCNVFDINSYIMKGFQEIGALIDRVKVHTDHQNWLLTKEELESEDRIIKLYPRQ